MELYEAQLAKLQAQVAQADEDKAALEGSLQSLRPSADGTPADLVRALPAASGLDSLCVRALHLHSRWCGAQAQLKRGRM